MEALRSILRDEQRLEAVRLGALYTESATWLYEDAGNMAQARHWTSRAMEGRTRATTSAVLKVFERGRDTAGRNGCR